MTKDKIKYLIITLLFIIISIFILQYTNLSNSINVSK